MNLPSRLILFSIDGMRPDGMVQAETPTIKRLMQTGASSLTVRSVMPSITLPCHTSMFHGVDPAVHGITTNGWEPYACGPIPGIFEQVRDAGKQPVSFYTWEELRDLSRPGTLAHSCFKNIYFPSSENIDLEIARLAANYIVAHQPDFTFIYLGLTDEIGHRYGWMSPEYLQAIATADRAIAHVLERLKEAEMADDTAILVTSDHGGHQHGHGEDCPEDMTIPWVLSGPGVRQGANLNGNIRIFDNPPTIARLLGLSIPQEWQGRVIEEALLP